MRHKHALKYELQLTYSVLFTENQLVRDNLK